ncbi:hypothetical protein [Pseudomonas aeruginosa]|uniref:hypothetical protein n=1 Tax=Pseudomonas aeruginosa TaxID=287 RepID=UPI000F843F5C|nr:hypothetical protein [Pseudomonas aeruginosa]RTT16296.1 hypothetical protein DY955_16760 [Pseudomonas aeruginosa]
MTESKICTCPSGDGSLVHPCPAHPAVEQVGGDERAAFELFVRKHCGMPAHIAVNWDAKFTNDAWEGWKARAALAQPSPASELDPLNLAPHAEAFNEAPAEALKPEQEQAEEERPPQPERYTADVFHPERPYYMAQTSVVRASDFDEFATQYERIVGALRAELETERMRLAGCGVAALGYFDGCADAYKSASLSDVLRLRADCDAALAEVERIKAISDNYYVLCVERQQQLDTALARVASLESKLAELEKQEPVGVMRASSEMGVAPYADIWPWLEPGQKLYTTPVAQAQQLNDLDKQCRDDVARALGLRPNQERGFAWSYLLASIKSCVKASGDSAQAQHSVPEVSGIGRDFAYPRSVVLHLRTEPTDDDLRAIHDGLRSLAAAPGKEVPQAWIDVQAERRRQVEAEGWTPEHDDLYCAAELPRAAAAYILNGANDEAPAIWPFSAKWWKPRDARSNYVRAGALILAEIERLDRAAPGKEGNDD